MHCSSCSQLIKRQLSKLPGISDARVNFASETAQISYNPDAVTLDQMNTELQKIGYALHNEDVHSIPDSHDGHTPTENGHEDHMNLSVSKERKLEELDALYRKTSFVLPLSLLIFALMIWDLAAKGISGVPNLPFPMELLNVCSFVMASAVLFGTGKQYIDAVFRFIKYRIANMDSLVGIGTLTAYIYSSVLLLLPNVGVSLNLPEGLYFDVTIVVIGFITVGKYLESRSKLQTGEAIEKLIQLQAKYALVIRNGKEVEIPISDVVVGDMLRIKPGQKIPVDATIIEGETAIDESMITGESLPVDKSVGDTIIGATVNTYGSITARAIKIGKETVLAQIINMVKEAQSSKAPIERLADAISSVFVPVVLCIAVVTGIGWVTIGSIFLPVSSAFSIGLLAFVGILVIACPCAMGLATPTAIIVGVGQAAQHGILIKNAESLERFSSIDTIVIDKTGTLTHGRPEVTDIVPVGSRKQSDVLRILAALENHSEHPLARAISEKAKSIRTLPIVTKFKAIPGHGVQGVIHHTSYAAGNIRLATKIGLTWNKEITDRFASEGKTPILLMDTERVIAYIGIADTVKENASESIKQLRMLGLSVIMLTGDTEKTAKFIGQAVHIDQVIADVLPQDKEIVIRNLQKSGKRVAMVGDGINDAPALARADVGIAMGTGTDVAIEAAGITLLSGNIAKISQAIQIARSTMNIIKQNLFWAFGYNVVLIPVAAGLLYPFIGVLLNPGFAAFAMAASSITVVSNSLRLQRLVIT